MKKLSGHIAIAMLLLASCQKTDTSFDDNIPPQIKVQYPLDNPALPKGFPLCMKVNVSDNSDLSSVTIEVEGSGFSRDYIPVTRFIDITEKFEPSPTLSGPFKASVRAVDHAGNTTVVTIPFSINN